MSNVEILKKNINKSNSQTSPSMIVAHFNPKELDIMDELQRGTKRDSSGKRTYTSLYHGSLKHSPIKEAFISHITVKPKVNALKELNKDTSTPKTKHGRFGDRELASIPHGLADIFDKAIGGRVHNPQDGHPEYFELAPKLGALANMFKSGAANAGNFLKNSGATLASSAKNAGSKVSSGLSKVGSSIKNKMPFQRAPSPSPSPASTQSTAAPQSWRNWAESGTRDTIGRPIEQGMRLAGGTLGGYAANRAANSMASAIPLPSSAVVGPATAYGAYKGQQKGRELGQGVVNALATGAGHLGGGVDYLANSPTVQNTVKSAGNAWNSYNPAGIVYRGVGGANFKPPASASVPSGLPGEWERRTPISPPIMEDVD